MQYTSIEKYARTAYNYGTMSETPRSRPLTDEEKEELSELQAVASRLGSWRKELLAWKADYSRANTILKNLEGIVGKRINDLKSSPDESITDHALIRYLERYTTVDIEELRESIRKLPTTDKVVINNNTITVGENVGLPHPRFSEKKAVTP